MRPRPCSRLWRRQHQPPSPQLWATRAPLIDPGARSLCVSLPGDFPTGFGNPAAPRGSESRFPSPVCWGVQSGAGCGVEEREGAELGADKPSGTMGEVMLKMASAGGQYPDRRHSRRTDTILPGDSHWGTVLCGAEVMGGDGCVCTAPSKTTSDDTPPG